MYYGKNDLIKRGSASDIIARRNRSIALLQQSAELLIEACQLGIITSHDLDDRLRWLNTPDDIPRFMEAATKAADRGGWQLLVNACDLRQLMDATAYKAFAKQISDQPPTLNADNVAATFSRFSDESELIFKRGLVTTFKRLDYRAFKTNSAVRFGKKIIMTNAIGGYGWSHWGGKEADMIDLERVFYTLESKKMPPRAESFAAAISHRAMRRAAAEPREAEDHYFHARWFKNGNLHLTFKRLDLVERCNDIIAEVHNHDIGHDINPAKHNHNFAFGS